MAWYTMEEMAEILKECPPSDPRMTEVIYNDVIYGAYLLYDEKRHKAVCTRCGGEWDIYPGEYAGSSHCHDHCPFCGEDLTCLSAGRGRMRFGEYHRIMSFAEKDGTFWAILNEITAVFDPFGRPDLYSKTRAVYKLNAEEQKYWKLVEPWSGEPYYTEPKRFAIPPAPGTVYGWSKYDDHIYSPDIKEMILDSDMRFLYEDWMQDEPEMNIVIRLAAQMKYPSVELLRKAGFTKIADIKLNGHGGARCVNWRGKTLEKILKLPRRWIKFLRPHDPNATELDVFQHMTEEEKRLCSYNLLRDMAYGFRDDARYRKVVEEYMSFKKWMKLISEWENVSPGHILSDYLDYMNTATKLGMDIRKKSIRYPKDLRAAHDAVMDLYQVERDRERDEKIAAKARVVEDYRIGDLTILPAMSQEDLNKESAGLGHCVKGYGDKIASGRCWIFFVRKIDEIDKPYYTMETDTEGKLKQCRGLKNCSMTDEVKAFTDSFIKDLQKEVSKERRLCQTA